MKQCDERKCSAAEPPLFWASEVQGPGADSGFSSDQIGSAPAAGKKCGSKRLWLHTLKFVILGS